MKLNSKKIVAKVKAILAADDPDKEYYSFENNTIKQTTGRDYSLKEWLHLYLDDFTEDIDIPLNDDDRERLLDEIKKEVALLLTTHIKKFFADNKNKVDEDVWDEEVADLKKQIKNHYWRASSYIEQVAQEHIRELTKKLKLV